MIKYVLMSKPDEEVSRGEIPHDQPPEVLFYGARPFIRDKSSMAPDCSVGVPSFQYVEATHYAVPRH